MKRYCLILPCLIVAISTAFCQDISSPAAVTLPQAPSTNYTVSSGQTVKIISGQSVTLGPGTHLQAGSEVNVMISNSPAIPAAPSNPAANTDKNWILSRAYDDDGNLIAESKSFFDLTGKQLQTQTKNISAGHVLAAQPLYDDLGRPAVQTLAAPINNSAFNYKADFVTNGSSGVYNYLNFDRGKLNNPDAVGSNVTGTLGWYYSDNNTLDAYVPSTAFPYSRTDFFNDGSGAAKRSAGIGEQLRMGLNHEAQGNVFPVISELNFYKTVRDKYFPESVIGASETLSNQAVQAVSVDENGHQVVSITDVSGQSVMSARPEPNGWLTVSNSIQLNYVPSHHSFTLTTAGMTMGGSDPNAGGLGQGPTVFNISSDQLVKVYKDGVEIYNGTGNAFEFGSASLNSDDYLITSDFPFTVSHDDGCNNCPSVVSEPTKSSVHYFRLFHPSAISVSGNATLYEMKGETAVSASGTLPAGYYKLAANDGDVTLNYTNSYSDISYAFYNQTGQLIASVAPEGVKKLVQNIGAYAAKIDIPFVTLNEYDLNGRLVATTSTDAGRSEYVYRTDGSIRFSQNAEQVKTGRFSYTNYDRWGRPVESGEYLPGNISFVSAKTDEALQENINPDGGLTSGSKVSWVRTHYDDPDNGHGLGNYIQDEGFLKGAVSWTENANGKTWYNYDDLGRLIWIVKQVNGLGVKTIDYVYNKQGSVSKVDFQKSNAAEQFIHEYDYDADGRLKVAYTSTATSGKKEQARYYYYLHGPLKRVELADNLQGIDYAYTTQGMLKSINHPQAASDPGKDGTQNTFAPDAFGMTLEYFNGDYTRAGSGISSLATGGSQTSYNGSIMAQSWRSQKPATVVAVYGTGVNNPAMFTYEYDKKYQFDNNKYGAPNFGSNSFTEAVNVNREHNLSYDANGNILSLNRADQGGNVKDNFTGSNYHYTANTNRLSSVDNYASYTYDDLGQMTGQVRANNQGYYPTYDVTGKVDAIYSDAAHTQLRISMLFDDSGMRIKKTDHVQGTSTWYVYDAGGNVLAMYNSSGAQTELPVYTSGRIGLYNRSANTYQYELTDDLGNVRVVIGGSKTTQQQADVIYYSDYYPFGSPMTLANNDYRYGYQGQYAEVDKETGWNNFQLRMYDPVIGRWMAPDPYKEFYSPYVGMGNNPVSTADPDGGCTLCPNDNVKTGDKFNHPDAGMLTYKEFKNGGRWVNSSGNIYMDDVVIGANKMTPFDVGVEWLTG